MIRVVPDTNVDIAALMFGGLPGTSDEITLDEVERIAILWLSSDEWKDTLMPEANRVAK